MNCSIVPSSINISSIGFSTERFALCVLHSSTGMEPYGLRFVGAAGEGQIQTNGNTWEQQYYFFFFIYININASLSERLINKNYDLF